MPIRAYDFVAGVETSSVPDPATPSASGDVVTLGFYQDGFTDFTLANNQATTNVTGLSFDKTVYRSFVIEYQIYRSASGGSTRARAGSLIGITDGSGWEMVEGPSAVMPADTDAGVTLTITSAGQIQYSTDDNGGSYNAANSLFSYKITRKAAL
jgi:hypothetical protein